MTRVNVSLILRPFHFDRPF